MFYFARADDIGPPLRDLISNSKLNHDQCSRAFNQPFKILPRSVHTRASDFVEQAVINDLLVIQ